MIDKERTTTEGDDQTDEIALHKDTLQDLDARESEADIKGGGAANTDYRCIQDGDNPTDDGT